LRSLALASIVCGAGQPLFAQTSARILVMPFENVNAKGASSG